MQSHSSPPAKRKRRDYRLPTLGGLVLAVVALGYLVNLIPSRGTEAVVQVSASRSLLTDLRPESGMENRSALSESLTVQPSIDPKDPEGEQAAKVMQQAGAQIKERRYEAAIADLTTAHALIQKYPESYLLLARALEGKKDYTTARDFYKAAIDKNPYLADAYFGFASASESLGDLESAIGGMRNYLHTERNADPGRLKVAQARSAIWEWESKLGRGQWGPSKGIPPGFTAAELKRDNRGVGIKMPIPGTEQPDGSVKYEIKHQDKFKIFKP